MCCRRLLSQPRNRTGPKRTLVAEATRRQTRGVEAGSVPPEAPAAGYSGAAVAGAVLATLLFPFISLLAALLLQNSETDPIKLSQLRTWAWVSGGWLAVGAFIVVALASITL